MKLSAKGEALMDRARERILAELDRSGPLPVVALPTRWPETRMLVRHLLDEMAEAGQVERARPIYGRPTYRITPRGRSRLRGLDVAGE